MSFKSTFRPILLIFFRLLKTLSKRSAKKKTSNTGRNVDFKHILKTFNLEEIPKTTQILSLKLRRFEIILTPLSSRGVNCSFEIK